MHSAQQSSRPEPTAVRSTRLSALLNGVRHLQSWVESAGWRPGVLRTLAALLIIAALASGLGTYLAMTGSLGLRLTPRGFQLLLLLDLILLLALGVIVAWRMVSIWIDQRRGLTGARLHAVLVLWFGLVAMAPTILVSVFSVLFFAYSMDSWFSDQVRSAVKDSVVIAEDYLNEHKERVSADALDIVALLRRRDSLVTEDTARLEALLLQLINARVLDGAAVIDDKGGVMAKALRSPTIQFDFGVTDDQLTAARERTGLVLHAPGDDRVRALVQIDPESRAYLYIGRYIDKNIISRLSDTQGPAFIYEQLEGQRFSIQTKFSLIFVGVALLLLLVAVWAALVFATRLVRPISMLVGAADRIGAGDLGTRVPEDDAGNEFSTLSRAFNRMTQQIESQRNDLIDANEQLEERRRFMEVVLAGVSAGVIGLDEEGRINLPNRSASDLLATDLTARIGEPIESVVPEMASLVDAARQRPSWLAESQINLVRGAETRTLLVRVVAEFMAARLIGFVVTFDDVTELLSAQRKAAWADVARRIAHEIKNPLTPIQLSAERLKRKYLKEISSDPETFTICTDTIVRQVGDIGRMVDEFSAFARMPAPVMAPEDLTELCRQAIFLQQSAYPEISFTTDFPASGQRLVCDAQQIGQALTNLLKNAAEAIGARISSGATEPPGAIQVAVRESDEDVLLTIADNGRGLPDQGRERLTEPYVTTRARGTGLGLAIVKKIVEDHGGLLQLDDRLGGGAVVRVMFRQSRSEREAPVETPAPRVRAHGR